MKFLALPTWGLAACVQQFLPISHPLKNENPSLQKWAKNRTDLCKLFDLFFWMQIPILGLLLRAVI